MLKQSAKEPDVYLELAGLDTGCIRKRVRSWKPASRPSPMPRRSMKPWPCWNFAPARSTSAIARLRQSLQLLPDEASLHWTLANILAEKGETNELRTEIDELRRLNSTTRSVEFLEAHHAGEFKGLAEGPPDADQAPDALF